MASFFGRDSTAPSKYPFAMYTNNTDVLIQQVGSTGRPFPDLIIDDGDTTNLMTYALNYFTFQKKCTVTVAYSITATAIVAGGILGANAQINGNFLSTGLGCGYHTRSASSTSMFLGGSFTFRVSPGDKLIFIVEHKNGTVNVTGTTLAANNARISFLFRDISD